MLQLQTLMFKLKQDLLLAFKEQKRTKVSISLPKKNCKNLQMQKKETK